MNRFNRSINKNGLRKWKGVNTFVGCINYINYFLISKKRINSYSVDQFDYYQCLFIHIPKAAGISVNRSLFGNLGGGHKSLRWYMDRYPKSTIDKFYKFTFVRNPWDRLFSAYNFLKKGGINLMDEEFRDNVLINFTDFNDFVMNWVNHENIYSYTHFIPQFEYLTNEQGQISMDYIGRFENIENDLDIILKNSKIPNHKELMVMNKTFIKSLDYKDHYSTEAKEKIYQIYKKDIELFKYTF